MIIAHHMFIETASCIDDDGAGFVGVSSNRREQNGCAIESNGGASKRKSVQNLTLVFVRLQSNCVRLFPVTNAEHIVEQHLLSWQQISAEIFGQNIIFGKSQCSVVFAMFRF